jgi:hypothetical protein
MHNRHYLSFPFYSICLSTTDSLFFFFFFSLFCYVSNMCENNKKTEREDKKKRFFFRSWSYDDNDDEHLYSIIIARNLNDLTYKYEVSSFFFIVVVKNS